MSGATVYSYVNNNPLSYTDPSGFSACGSRFTKEECNAIRQGVAENAKILADFNAWAFSIADEYNGWVGVPSVNWGAPGVAPTLSGTGVSQSPTGMGQSPWPGPGLSESLSSGHAAGTGASGGASASGSATFQICQEGYGCSEPINPDLLEVVPTAYPIQALDTGAVVSVAGPVEFAAFGLAGVLRAAAAEGVAGAGSAASEFNYTQTVLNNVASRPYINSPLTAQEIINTGTGVADPGGIAGALRFDVPGAFNGSQGFYQLVFQPTTNTIFHFLFTSGP